MLQALPGLILKSHCIKLSGETALQVVLVKASGLDFGLKNSGRGGGGEGVGRGTPLDPPLKLVMVN